MPTIDGLGGKRTIIVNLGDVVVVDNFGVFGTVNPPSAALLAELDTLQFVGSGLTASNMLMRQNGADVVITFEGIVGTQVTFKNVALQDLENVTGTGNFIFNGQTAVANSLDVIDGTANPSAVLSSGTTTFLNDLNNVTAGGSSSDVINGQGGNDTIDGRTGNDILRGGDGNDVLKGGSGNDRLSGDEGNDSLEGGSGNDVLRGGAGNDVLTGGSGNDNQDGGAGSDDYRVGGTGDGFDTFSDTGSGDTDRILATANNTRVGLASGFGPSSGIEEISANGFTGVSIGGGTGNDSFDFSATALSGITRIDAGSGNDTVTGSGGDDTFVGGSGNDVLKGGAGNDAFTGGTGNDTVDGGDDTNDSAVFAGARVGYQITTVGGTTTVRDLLPFTAGNDGTDTITNVERLVFSDQVVILNQAPSAINLVNTTTTIDENTDTSTGIKVADIAVTDDGLGTNVLGLTGADSGSFEVVGTALFLKAGVLNFEAKQSYAVQVTVNDATVGVDPDATSSLFTVNVIDMNENPAAPADFAVNTAENVNDATVLATVMGTDADLGGGNDGDNNFEDLSYAIHTDASGKFEIDSATGQISLKASQPLDFESAQSHVVTVRVSDGPDLFDDVEVTINVTDANDAPTAVTLVNTTTTIVENTDTSAGIKVADIVVTDDALGSHVLILRGVDPAIEVADAFQIIGTELYLRAGVLNFEGQRSFSVRVMADDPQINPDPISDVLTISVSDEIELDESSLTLLNGENGFILVGVNAYDLSGLSISSLGDINGDGFDDLIVGAQQPIREVPEQDPDSERILQYSGEAYVVFGKDDWTDTPRLDLATLDGSNGFRVVPIPEFDASMLGRRVSGAGDVNGDGFADIFVAAPYADRGDGTYSQGETYVIFGKANWAGETTFQLSSINGSNGFRLRGVEEGDASGADLSNAGDVNGDGFDDLIIGALHVDQPGGPYDIGAAYVVFGRPDWSAQPILELSVLDGTNGFRLTGADDDDKLGRSVASAGDVNGDGFDDLIVGASEAESAAGETYAGAAYILFGRPNWTETVSLNVADFDGLNGVAFSGTSAHDRTGISVSSIGDFNGDRIDDVAISAPLAQHAGGEIDEGLVYVLFGKTDWSGVPLIDATLLDGAKGLTLAGIDVEDRVGISVSGAGDVNGDGIDDLLIGAPGAENAVAMGYQGETYVVYGNADWSTSPVLDLVSLDGSNGFRLTGVDRADGSGVSVSSAGDVNGDGYDDMFIGAFLAEGPNGPTSEGESYVIFGGNFNGAVTHLGTATSEALIGTAAAETFVLGQGDDTAIGNGGADAFQGGAGNDTLVIGNEMPFDVDGGSGIDTANLNAIGPSIDLSGLDATRFHNIERFDLSGSQTNTLVMDKDAVLHIAGTNGASFPSSTIVIEGDSGDVVSLVGDWAVGATLLNPLGQSGSYTIYANGQATLLVEAEVATVIGGLATDRNDVLIGAPFVTFASDVIDGGAGDDTLDGLGGADSLVGGTGNDTLVGGTDNDFLSGGEGNDYLDGGAGADTMIGGAGDDTYWVDSVDDVVTEEGFLISGALLFDGVDDWVEVIDQGATSLDVTSSFTVEAWVNFTEWGSPTWSAIVNKAFSHPSSNITFALMGNNHPNVQPDGELWGSTFSNQPYWTVLEDVTGIRDGAWHHLALVYDQAATEIAIYVDGNLASAAHAAGTPVNTDFSVNIGNLPGHDPRFFKGMIDDVRLWSRALTPAEIEQGLQSVIADPVAGLAGAWNFEEGAGVTANDQSGNGNAGTVLGGATWVADARLIGSVDGGIDEIRTTLPVFTLPDNVENLTFLGAGTFAGTGNDLDNRIVGGGDADTLSGGVGDDLLIGGAGADTLDGGAGNDTIDGGVGDDLLSGGSGVDHFVASGGHDVIQDFSQSFAAGERDFLSLRHELGVVRGFNTSVLTLSDGSTVELAGGAAWNIQFVTDAPEGNSIPLETFNNLPEGTIAFRFDADSAPQGTIIARQLDGVDSAVISFGYFADQSGQWVDGDLGRLYVHLSNGQANLASSSVLSSGTHDVVITFGPTGTRIFLDGSLDAESLAPSHLPDQTGPGFAGRPPETAIGAWQLEGTAVGQFDGTIHEVTTYSHAASAPEVGNLFSNPSTALSNSVLGRFGSAEDDTIVIRQTLPLHVDGDLGIDTANLDALASIDLRGSTSSVFHGIEKFDLSGLQANTLILDANAVLATAGENDPAFLANTLLVKGDAGDIASLVGTGWSQGATVPNPFGETGSYVTYTNGQATLLIESNVRAHTFSLDLATLDGTNGFTIVGADAGDRSGFSVASAGDVNGDGFDDLIIGAPFAESSGGGDEEGESYVVFGKANGFGSSLDLAALDGANGFRLVGIDVSDRSGFSVASAGDVNGDGFDDLMIGSYFAESAGGASEEGETYVVFGKASGFGASLDLAALDGANGFRLVGVDADDRSGRSVASAGDFNGDGFDDLFIGAPYAESSGGGTSEGESYVVFGRATGFGASLDLAALDGASGFRLVGVDAYDLSGFSVASAGDVNGDGFDDLIVGAIFATSADGPSNEGESYVVFGSATSLTSSLDLATLDGSNGFRLIGVDGADLGGASVASAGDVNGDGSDDLIVGAFSAESADVAADEGESYVIFGRATGFGSSLDLAALDGTNGFRLVGVDAADLSGRSVASAGDVNGDGFDDLIVGAPLAESTGGGNEEGESYVVFGKATGFGSSVDLATLDATSGFRLVGIDASDRSGFSVVSAGDVNGDGFDDLMIGAYFAESAGGAIDEGESYIIFGGNFTGSVTHLGTVAGDTLIGTSEVDVMVGGLGNDTLFGEGGADVLMGGAGNDTLEVSDLGFFRADGGSGDDTLRLLVSGAIDIGSLDGNAATSDRGKLAGIEVLDVTNCQANALTLSLAAVLDLNVDNVDPLGTTIDNVLAIKGEAGDTLALINPGADSWAASGGTFARAGATYQLYTAGPTDALKVAVDTDILVTPS